MTDFEAFWQTFPRRTGKLDAMKAYGKARSIATANEILEGVALYIRYKPEYADWCHPATWLNKGRWMDEYDEPVKVERARCTHTPECHNTIWCQVVEARKRGEVA